MPTVKDDVKLYNDINAMLDLLTGLVGGPVKIESVFGEKRVTLEYMLKTGPAQYSGLNLLDVLRRAVAVEEARLGIPIQKGSMKREPTFEVGIQKVHVTKADVGDEPVTLEVPCDLYCVGLSNSKGTWPETFGDVNQLRLFLLGVKATASMYDEYIADPEIPR